MDCVLSTNINVIQSTLATRPVTSSNAWPNINIPLLASKHLNDEHQVKIIDLDKQFSILRKYHGKLDCLIYEMLFICLQKPKLNTQSDSIRAKLLFLFYTKLFDTQTEFINFSDFYYSLDNSRCNDGVETLCVCYLFYP